MVLAEVLPGRDVVIDAMRGTGDASARLREIGLRPGVSVRVVQRSTFGAVVVSHGFSSVALDRETARSISVEEVCHDVSLV
jgi:ferrous iron transport protein A